MLADHGAGPAVKAVTVLVSSRALPTTRLYTYMQLHLHTWWWEFKDFQFSRVSWAFVLIQAESRVQVENFGVMQNACSIKGYVWCGNKY